MECRVEWLSLPETSWCSSIAPAPKKVKPNFFLSLLDHFSYLALGFRRGVDYGELDRAGEQDPEGVHAARGFRRRRRRAADAPSIRSRRPELGEVLGAGEHRRQRFPSPWIWDRD